ncbi:MauE/DoxX family redox-associated membrane protein [Nocardioides sp.]|uniref:MauE/DoxX family redox-associated membrane protein n=1 Tax=Nocardioides sp. TaxID=35761 RepID=UPI0039C9E645
MAPATICILNSCAASLLLVAGTNKLVAPNPLAAALEELAGSSSVKPNNTLVRCIALAECAAAFGLSIDRGRLIAAPLVGCLGLGMALLGLVGIARRTTLPCGCLGTHHGPTLGAQAMICGVGILLVWPFNVLYGTTAGAFNYTPTSSVLTALIVLLATIWIHRLGVMAVWPWRKIPTGMETP